MCHACVFGASFPVYFGSETGNKLQMHNIVAYIALWALGIACSFI